jgi:imidazolonepropionase-like amidohydrolase
MNPSSVDNAQMTMQELEAVIAAAHDYGFTVAAHAHGAEAIRRAVTAGVDSIEHGTYMSDADMKLMKQRGTWYVPTIIAGRYVAEKATVPGYYRNRSQPRHGRWARSSRRPRDAPIKAGVKIAFGTDAGVYPHGQNAKEFEYMVEAGIPNAYALQARHVNAAALLKQSDNMGRWRPASSRT